VSPILTSAPSSPLVLKKKIFDMSLIITFIYALKNSNSTPLEPEGTYPNNNNNLGQNINLKVTL